MVCSEKETEKRKNPGRIIKRVLSTLITVILVLSLTISITVTLKKIMGKSPDFCGFRIFYIATDSMEPTISAGAAILTHQKPDRQYENGDIITFISSDPAIFGQPNTHRIVDYIENPDGRIYTTKGDHNPTADLTPVYAEAVLGKVVFTTGRVRFFGMLVGVITTPMGFITVIVFPILAILSLSLRDFAKACKELRNEEEKKGSGFRPDNSWMYDENSPEMQELLRREAEARMVAQEKETRKQEGGST